MSGKKIVRITLTERAVAENPEILRAVAPLLSHRSVGQIDIDLLEGCREEPEAPEELDVLTSHFAETQAAEALAEENTRLDAESEAAGSDEDPPEAIDGESEEPVKVVVPQPAKRRWLRAVQEWSQGGLYMTARAFFDSTIGKGS